jgi:1,4-dihydroxy-2-naphthoate octaprenyltransferase
MIRPKTLTAAIVPFVCGSALAYSHQGAISWLLIVCGMMAALAIQIATNLINDACDFSRGADTLERLGPQRAIQSGMANVSQVYSAGIFFFIIAAIWALPLLAAGGTWVAIVLACSIASGYLYTGGPYPLAYLGLGDLFVLLFFGCVSTVAAYSLQVGGVSPFAWLLSLQIGLLCTVLIAINNLRDIASDCAAGKKTLAVRFGKKFTRLEIAFLALTPYLAVPLWFAAGYRLAALLSLLTLPLAIYITSAIWRTEPSSSYNRLLGLAALLHLLFGVAMTLGFLI